MHPDTKKADMLISGQICIDSFRLVQSKDDESMFISMPSIKRVDPEGNTQYERVVTISKDYKEAFNKEILDKYQKYSKSETIEKAAPGEEEKPQAVRV